MALEATSNRRSPSPSSSERSSSVSRLSRFQGNDEPVRRDKSYRRYAAGVERVLSVFDTGLQEWADYISFLGRLLKALQAHPPDTRVVPFKSVVAKRLAQCLNPSLPSGVHQKTLEIYSYIFELIGIDILARDLPLYLPGLCPALSFASLSVRPLILSLWETYLVKVRHAVLRPALKAIIMALLPGLEEESSEDFQRVLDLLEGFRVAVNQNAVPAQDTPQISKGEYFWQCFFLASIASHSRRQGVLAYLTRRLPRSTDSVADASSTSKNAKTTNASDPISSASIESVLHPEPGLLIRCFISGLSDEQMLVQRGFLDLLVTHLPLHSEVIQKRVTPEDRERLISAAVGVVTRKDMSLNRRLWSWLLGSDATKHDAAENTPLTPTNAENNDKTFGESARLAQTRYFQHYGLESLARSILKAISYNQCLAVDGARVFRICLSLMDRWEVGSLVIPRVLIPLLNYVRQYEKEAPSRDDFLEVIRSANMFFDGVDCGLIWGEILNLLIPSPSCKFYGTSNEVDQLGQVKFIITRFNMADEEMLVLHLPLVLLAFLAHFRFCYQQYVAALKADVKDFNSYLQEALLIADLLASLIPEKSIISDSSKPNETLSNALSSQQVSGSEAVNQIKQFYEHGRGIAEVPSPPYSKIAVGGLLLREGLSLVQGVLEPILDNILAEQSLKILNTLLARIAISATPNSPDLFSAFTTLLDDSQSSLDTPIHFPILAAQISVICILTVRHDQSVEPYFAYSKVKALLPMLVRQLWTHLSPSNIKHHVEAVQCLWQLQAILPTADRSIKATICARMSGKAVDKTGTVGSADSGRRFASIWTYSFQSYSKAIDHDNEGRALIKSSQMPHQIFPARAKYEVMLSRPLYLMLDALSDENSEEFLWVRSWLQNLANRDKLFRFLAGELLAFRFLQSIPSAKNNGVDEARMLTEEDDLTACLYYFQTLSNILRCCTSDTWASLSTDIIANEEDIDTQVFSNCGIHKDSTLQAFFSEMCVRAITTGQRLDPDTIMPGQSKLLHMALALLQQLLTNPYASTLEKLHLEHPIIERLIRSLEEADFSIQILLLDAALAALSLKALPEPQTTTYGQRTSISKDSSAVIRKSTSSDRSLDQSGSKQASRPQLGKCLLAGFSSKQSQPVLDAWVNFLTECLPLFGETIFQVLIPLVECLCTQVMEHLEGLKSVFDCDNDRDFAASDASILALLSAFEPTLAYGHGLLSTEDTRSSSTRPSGPPQGFLGNVVSGVFSTEAPQTKNAATNNRLTVILAFKDTLRTCFEIWLWSQSLVKGVIQRATLPTTLAYTSTRVKYKARRLLENLFLAEPLECLESLVELWRKFITTKHDDRRSSVVTILHVLDSSKPKHIIPALFNAIYSRTNPNALDPSRKSTLTSSLADTDLVAFLAEYARSIDDDAMDEIWTDCMIFLRDVLSNPFPHRQILSRLLEFIAILGEKVNNTSFGDQRMRRDLSDLFLRLLTAIFTVKPMGFSQELAPASFHGNSVDTGSESRGERSKEVKMTRNDDVVAILAAIVTKLPQILSDSDRILGAVQIISSSVLAPAFRSRFFPDNFSADMVRLLYHLSGLTNAQKFWKKDVAEAFNHPRFFASPLKLVKDHWLPLIRQWTLGDNDRMPELLSRLVHPTTAGIMFGVGASSARLEADRKTQLNLRRICLVILASPVNNFITNLPLIQEKVDELLSATPATSPSSNTRAETYMVLRALILRVSSIHLSPLWSTISPELQSAISSVLLGEKSNVYSESSVFQACRLLDTLIVLAPEEFQLQEWLFVTDNIDAVYRPPDWKPTALVDEVAKELDTITSSSISIMDSMESRQNRSVRKPLLPSSIGNGVQRDELLAKVLRPFFAQLSIYAFESMYSMGAPDVEACVDTLLADLCDETTVTGA